MSAKRCKEEFDLEAVKQGGLHSGLWLLLSLIPY